MGLFQIIKRMYKRYDKQILKNIINLKMGGQVVQSQFLASGQHLPEYYTLRKILFSILNVDSLLYTVSSCRSKSARFFVLNFKFCLSRNFRKQICIIYYSVKYNKFQVPSVTFFKKLYVNK